MLKPLVNLQRHGVQLVCWRSVCFAPSTLGRHRLASTKTVSIPKEKNERKNQVIAVKLDANIAPLPSEKKGRSKRVVEVKLDGNVALTLKEKKEPKKKSVTVKLEANVVPQGVIEGEPLQDEVAEEGGWPTVIQQALNNMRKFSHCVLLTRVGSFYELYFEQATEYGSLLGIKVASKPTRLGRVPMAGFPFTQLDRYLKVLVQDLGKSVAISEEIRLEEHERIKFGGNQNDRQVRRVITPGTLIDEHFLNPFEHNYLLALDLVDGSTSLESKTTTKLEQQEDAQMVGLAWLDLSSGDFVTQTTTLDALGSAIARIGPREILVRPNLNSNLATKISTIAQANDNELTYHTILDKMAVTQTWNSMLENQLSPHLDSTFANEEVSTAQLLLDYVTSQLPGLQVRLQAPFRRLAQDYMSIDRNSLRGLEILRTMRDGVFKGSLLHAVRRTSTESGSRLLAQRLVAPSTSPTEINERLDIVETLMADPAFLEHLTILLRKTSDVLRLVQRFSLGRGDTDDLLKLCRTVEVTKYTLDLLTKHFRGTIAVQILARKFHWEGPTAAAQRVREAIDEDSLDLQHQNEEAMEAEAIDHARSVLSKSPRTGDLAQLQKRVLAKQPKRFNGQDDEDLGLDDIYIMKRTASPNLSKLHERLDELRQEKGTLADTLRKRTGADSLSLKFTPGLAYICHIRGKDTKLDLSDLDRARTVSSSKSTRSFYLPAWTELGRRIDEAKSRIHAEERITFKALRELVIENLVPLRLNANLLDELDVAASFARLALELDLKRPILNHSTETKIYGGRHIMVDAGLTESGRQFTPNDCHLGGPTSDAERIWLITGPNMAGKSTFLRQTALISILAQVGSFVPAEYAEIGLVDQIFSRVGSADNLSRDQSTFMVEMMETSLILRHATERSFVIMDEVGRGTTPEDGVAVGYAVLEHLRGVNRCRALFATHFHGLADMTESWKEVGAYCTDVREEDNVGFRYDHRLRRGVNRESHALKVAKLAGMPNGVIKSAQNVLAEPRGAEGTRSIAIDDEVD